MRSMVEGATAASVLRRVVASAGAWSVSMPEVRRPAAPSTAYGGPPPPLRR